MKETSATIYTDGASRGNPGHAAWAYIILQNSTIVKKDSGYCEFATNNQAEYAAVIHALADAADEGFRDITLYSDSQLIIRQLRGEYKVRDRCLRHLYTKTKGIINKFDSISFKNVPRSDKNISIADRMCNDTLDRVKKGGKITVPEELYTSEEITLRPVGVVKSSYRTTGEAPRQGRLSDEIAEIHIFPEYADALYKIENCNHLVVLCWFDRAERTLLRATPPGHQEERGVFALRSPARPNPIGLETVDLVSTDGLVLTVRGLDAVNNTPVLDIKPYITFDDLQTTSNTTDDTK